MKKSNKPLKLQKPLKPLKTLNRSNELETIRPLKLKPPKPPKPSNCNDESHNCKCNCYCCCPIEPDNDDCSNMFIVKGKCLCHKINQVNLKICINGSNRTLVIGTVMTESGDPINGAAVVVTRIDTSVNPNQETYMGMTFTQSDGTYAFTVEVADNYEYRLSIYSSLIK